MAVRVKAAIEWTSSFFMARERWLSAVLGVMSKMAATWRVVQPKVTSRTTLPSLGVKSCMRIGFPAAGWDSPDASQTGSETGQAKGAFLHDSPDAL
jgi:hypothetical protein